MAYCDLLYLRIVQRKYVIGLSNNILHHEP